MKHAHKNSLLDGRYSEDDTTALFNAIGDMDITEVDWLLGQDSSLARTPHTVNYRKYSDFAGMYITRTEELTPLQWATLGGNQDIIDLIRTYGGSDGRSKSKKARKSSRSKKVRKSKRTKKSPSKKVRKSKRSSKKVSRRTRKN